MSRVINSAYEYKWLIETVYPDFEGLLPLFDNHKDNRTYDTATNGGTQYTYKTSEIEKVADILRDHVNYSFRYLNHPVEATDFIIGWSIKYQKHGWQAMHNHSRPGEVVSCVLYFDTNETENNSDGAFYAVMPDTDGEQFVHVCPYWAGKMILLDGSVWHGSYPTQAERRILVLEFEQKNLNNTQRKLKPL